MSESLDNRQLQLIDDILGEPERYIGSTKKHTHHHWVYENEEEYGPQMAKRVVSFVPGLYRIFDEILGAAANKQLKSVNVTIDIKGGLIIVKYTGDAVVPVKMDEKENIYQPELSFGHLPISNYKNGDRGVITNIFSTYFMIEIADVEHKKQYKQVFSNNMKTKQQATVTECEPNESWTRVSFKPDLSRFGMDILEDDIVALMKKRVVDIAGCLGDTVIVELDGKRVRATTFEEYVSLYFPSTTDASLRIYKKFIEGWEVCVCLSDGQFEQISLVNTVATIEGGVHVSRIASHIVYHMTKVLTEKFAYDPSDVSTIEDSIWVFVNVVIDNPSFGSKETKEKLTIWQGYDAESRFQLTDEFLMKVATSRMIKKIHTWVELKRLNDLNQQTVDGGDKNLGIPKLEDAYYAGGQFSNKCTLILVEGDSAKAFVMSALSMLDQDCYGVFPLRGKFPNVRKKSPQQLQQNAEICKIVRILGLEYNKKYVDAKSLRYGRLIIMADQDPDGAHLKGLLINFFYTLWPSLLKVKDFLCECITPLIKVRNDKTDDVFSFYSELEYKKWADEKGAEANEFETKYYKGLGASGIEEAADYFTDFERHMKPFVWKGHRDGKAIDIAFCNTKVDERKAWIKNALSDGPNFDSDKVRYCDFITKEVINFSKFDLQRSIPSMVDGLKVVERQILFCAFKKAIFKEIKVLEFTGYVSENTAYCHGEESLISSIIGMAQNYVGSNNINLFCPCGQFGSRRKGGKDHAKAKYISTKLSRLTRLLFVEADERILEFKNVHGKAVQPTWYIPIIPMVLVNGSDGIGTGWSSFIPKYKPQDIIKNLRNLLDGKDYETMMPWYKGFNGKIKKTTQETTYTTEGLVNVIENEPNKVRITELPIRKWTETYKDEVLEVALSGENKTIEEYKAGNDAMTVNFEVTMSVKQMEEARKVGLEKKLKLISNLNLTNMHVLDENGDVKKYLSPKRILEDFMEIRLRCYGKRKKAMLEDLRNSLLQLKKKKEFIRDYSDGKISRYPYAHDFKGKVYEHRSPEEAVLEATGAVTDHVEGMPKVDEENVKPGTPYHYLLSVNVGMLYPEDVKKLEAEYSALEKEIAQLDGLTSTQLWLNDLDALQNELDAQNKRDEMGKEKRSNQLAGAKRRRG